MLARKRSFLHRGKIAGLHQGRDNHGTPHWIVEAALKLRCGHSRPAVRLEAVEELRDGDDVQKHAAIFVAAVAGAAREDPSDEVREAAVEALSQTGPEAAPHADVFAAALLQGGYSVTAQHAAIDGITGLGPEEAPRHLIHLRLAALQCADPEVRKRAATSLREFPDDIALHVRALSRCLRRDTNKVMRLRAAQALEGLNEDAGICVQEIADAVLEDPEVGVRAAAAKVVPQLGLAARVAKSVFKKALKDESSEKRKAAAKALINLGEVHALEVQAFQESKLAEATEHYYDKLFTLANAEMQASQSGNLDAMMRRPSQNLMARSVSRRVSAESLEEGGTAAEEKRTAADLPGLDAEPPEKLLSFLAEMAVHDSDDGTRLHAAEALVQLGSSQEQLQLTKQHITKFAEIAVKEDDPRVRRQAAEALSVTGDFRAVQAKKLVRVLQRPHASADANQKGPVFDPVAAKSAMVALRQIGTPAVPHRDVIVNTLKDGSTLDLRVEAARSLGVIRTPRSSHATALAAVATDTADSLVMQREAARALAKLGSRGNHAAAPLATSLSAVQLTEARARLATPMLRAEVRCMTPAAIRASAHAVLSRWECSMTPHSEYKAWPYLDD